MKRQRIDKATNKSPGQKTLRHGNRSVAGVQGHELRRNEPRLCPAGKFIFAAYFEVGGTAGDAYQPWLRLSIDPTQLPTSIDYQHLLALWDAILLSITTPR